MTDVYHPRPALPPPANTVGIVGWLKRNLFSTPLNSILTLLGFYLVYLIIPPLFRWVFWEADWSGTSREDCTGAGACWVFIRVRLDQFLYGFYPEAHRWRVNSALCLSVVIALPFLLNQLSQLTKIWIGVLLLSSYPAVAFVLLQGGILGLTTVDTHLWGGLMLTLIISAVGMTVALPLGILLALGRRSTLPIIRWLSIGFIEFWRGVPLITVLFMASVMLPLFLPEGVSINKLLRALMGIILFEAAYMAEVVRGGLQAIPKGQYEAAAALGLGYWRTMGLIILPQALQLVIPGIVNTFIALFKDTTLIVIIGLFDVLGMIHNATTDPKWLGFAAEGYVFAAAIFWVFCFSMSRVSQRLEKRLQQGQAHR